MVVKDFHLPKSAGRKSLVFAVSLSGDTGETLSILSEGRKRGCALVAVSSGGELETRSKKLGIPFNRVERLLVPRASLPGMALVPFRIMQELGIVRAPRDMKDIAVSLSKIFTEVSPRTDFESNPAKKLARKLWKRRPVIYSSSKYASAARHFKASMNENAKTPVSVDYFPELFHNEVETWLSGGKRAVVLLRHQGEDLEIQRKLAKAESILAQKGIPVTEVRQDGEMLTSLLNWCLFLDMVSVYVSVLNGRAPLQTPMIDIIKSGSR
jgi:glucose/mannose-6-phosphate isomerase